MNSYQRLWFEQTKSDHSVMILLRRQGAARCHQLHYLQMVTEKLGKAYFWRTGSPPPKRHASFVRFLQTIDDRKQSERDRIAAMLKFPNAVSLRAWIKQVSGLAHALEHLAPALCNDGPNPEYPWPQKSPVHAPAAFNFPIWDDLENTSRGRMLLNVIDALVVQFPNYAA